jgi:PAS domain S-box-containing protein
VSIERAKLLRLAEMAAADSIDARRMLQEVVDAISEGFVLYDADDRLILCNQKYREIYALSADVIVPGNSFEHIIRSGAERGQYAEAIGRVDAWVAERVAMHRNPPGPIDQRLSNGRWLRITEYRTPSGWIAGLRIDITELKQAEEAARRSEQRYRNLVERTNVVAYSYRLGDKELSYVAPQAARFLGYSIAELASGAFWFEHMHADDRAEVARLGEAMAHRRQDHNLEYRMITADGKTVWVRDIVTFDDGPDGMPVAHGIIVDIFDQKRSDAALRESEERFRTMADTMPALLWLNDPDGKTVFVNQRWLDYTGRSFHEEQGDGWRDSIHPEDRERVIAAMAAARESRTALTIEYQMRRKDGQYRWFLDTTKPRFTPAGDYLGDIGILVDINDRRHLEAQLQQAQKMEAVGQLTGGIAHDFNNLLCVVIGNLELLRDCGGDAAAAHGDWIDMALAGAQRGAQLTTRLLAFSRRQTLQPRAIDLNQMIAEIDGLLRRTLRADIAIGITSEANLWLATADKGQVENCLLNLAINARDAMPDGGELVIETANIHLDTHYAACNAEVSAGDYVMLSVRDTGTGMSPEVLKRAVEPFFTTKRNGRGTGLGLSMIYGFAKQSGGHLRIDSAVGRGTCVRLYLPRAAADSLQATAAATGTPQRSSGRETVLVVEDEENVRAVALGQLRALGYRVLAANDGAAARDIIAGDAPIDLLFTDIVMPGGISGWQLAELARSLRPGLPVLFTTGYAEHGSIKPGKPQAGALLLGKPYRRHELAQKVREALGQRITGH